MDALALPPDEVHLWWAFPDDPRQEAVCEVQRHVLSAGEQARERQFLQEKHRREFRVSHALVRAALSRYAPEISPAAWAFGAGEHGRPRLAGPAGYPWLRFNLSHTAGRAVVAVMRDADVGVDVENTAARTGDNAVAEAHFHPAEQAAYRRDPACFFDIWTLKEAYLKALGAGLGTVELPSFGFDLADPQRPRLLFDEPAGSAEERWWFHLQRGEGFRLALAARTRHPALRVVERTIVPLAP